VLGGDSRAVARAISLVEDGSEALEEISANIMAGTGKALSIGLTGAPGVGKSTLAARLVAHLRSDGDRVGVLAIDPTSPFTGGALLGDRVRMQEHATDPGVFIRSMATRGHLGGMALAAPEAVRILDAAGYDVVIVETVGVGQSEVEVASQADSTVVVVAPGWGDAIQVAKAGILEVADVFVVNKSDKDDADRTVKDLRSMLEMDSQDDPPPIVQTTAVEGGGIVELWNAIFERHVRQRESGELAERRRSRLIREVESLAAEKYRMRAVAALDAEGQIAEDLVAGRIDPYRAAGLLSHMIGSGTG
jgi:LAO/AO transport system kinase